MKLLFALILGCTLAHASEKNIQEMTPETPLLLNPTPTIHEIDEPEVQITTQPSYNTGRLALISGIIGIAGEAICGIALKGAPWAYAWSVSAWYNCTLPSTWSFCSSDWQNHDPKMCGFVNQDMQNQYCTVDIIADGGMTFFAPFIIVPTCYLAGRLVYLKVYQPLQRWRWQKAIDTYNGIPDSSEV